MHLLFCCFPLYFGISELLCFFPDRETEREGEREREGGESSLLFSFFLDSFLFLLFSRKLVLFVYSSAEPPSFSL